MPTEAIVGKPAFCKRGSGVSTTTLKEPPSLTAVI
jgi:hypothetical protein